MELYNYLITTKKLEKEIHLLKSKCLFLRTKCNSKIKTLSKLNVFKSKCISAFSKSSTALTRQCLYILLDKQLKNYSVFIR